MIERYFDNAATTPVDPRVLDEMLPYLRDGFGNANSLHEMGRRAESAVELARDRVAKLIGAEDPSQITFTSGATEANNWVLRSVGSASISPFEHSSLFEPARSLGSRLLRNDGLEIRPETEAVDLVSVMAVNNEIGTRWDARLCKGNGLALHSDLTQAVGKVPVDLGGLDFGSFSGHKFYGPKGIGALYSKETPPDSMILGGEQEGGFRAGTLNVPGIVGMGAAAAIAEDELRTNLTKAEGLRDSVLGVFKHCSDVLVNGGDHVSPYVLSLSFLGLEGETLVIEMDRKGYAISGGAACSSRSAEPSHVLEAIGLEPAWLRGTIRISFGKYNEQNTARDLALSILDCVNNLRKIR